jgi:hypothetical protein
VHLTGLELGGGARSEGAQFFGGGFGLSGALEGMAVASILNALTRKTKINTGLIISAVGGEALLHHGEFVPADLRTRLSPLFARYQAAQQSATAVPASDPISQLERLAQLRASGLLTDEEFEALRARQVQRLADDG